MTDVADLITAFVAVAKDPKAWEKRIDDMNEAAGKLSEARKLKKDSDDAAKAAATDLETARYERGQAELNSRNAAQQAASNLAREKELKAWQTELTAREQVCAQREQQLKAEYDHREGDLRAREQLAAKKLDDATKLMASYDEAKHQAAMKLAS
jgi:hypothetical protein